MRIRQLYRDLQTKFDGSPIEVFIRPDLDGTKRDWKFLFNHQARPNYYLELKFNEMQEFNVVDEGDAIIAAFDFMFAYAEKTRK